MPRFSDIGPIRAPHRTLQFWMLVGLQIVALLCAPMIFRLIGAPFPPTPFYRWLQTVLTMLPIIIALFWLGLRFGRVAWLAIGVGFLALGLVFRYSL